MAQSSQKFIARNRAPRVQIEYDVELYGAEKKVQLPFVMGVLSDLSGKPTEPLAPVADRKFLEVDVDNFDSRMKAIRPRAAFQVPNTLTGEGNGENLTVGARPGTTPVSAATSPIHRGESRSLWWTRRQGTSSGRASRARSGRSRSTCRRLPLQPRRRSPPRGRLA